MFNSNEEIMKQIRYILTKVALAAIVILPVSCEYLDYEEDKMWTEELVWSEYSYVRQSLIAVYRQLPTGLDNLDDAFLASTTDDAEHADLSHSVDYFNRGTVTSFNHPNGAWDRNYEGIRLANTFIAKTDTVTFHNDRNREEIESYREDLKLWRGEALFLKAFFYFELMKRYGAVPVVESWEDPYTPANSERKEVAWIADYIAELCDQASAVLPDRVTGDTELGRPSKGAAAALKCRTFLYAASPLHNPDGTNDVYYKKCIQAASEVFELGYELVTKDQYVDLFTPGTDVQLSNKEVIFDRRSGNSNNIEKRNYPVGFEQGRGLTNPTQDLVDAFGMSDGSSFDWNNEGHAKEPYMNRDPRLYATVLLNGDTVRYGDPDKARDVQVYSNGGLDRPNQGNILGTRTGYYLKKFVNTNLDLTLDNKQKHYWFYFRYSEILLNYAEAVNAVYDYNQTLGNSISGLQALNEVRERVGLDPLVDGMSKEEFFEKVVNERRVELAFENHRHWDLRRWKMIDALNKPIHGVDIEREVKIEDVDGEEKEVVTFKYQQKEVEPRYFQDYMCLYPIPRSEVAGGIRIPQNPGW